MAYQKDISAILGLSVSTVSRALKGYPDISEKTRSKVLQTAEELDYRSGLRDSMTAPVRLSGTIGVLASHFETLMEYPYYREMLCGMALQASLSKKDIILMAAEPDERGMSAIGKAAYRKVDGICLLVSREELYVGRYADLLKSRIPVVCMEHHVPGHTSVGVDYRGNVQQLLRYLKERGHVKIAHFGNQSSESGTWAVMMEEEAKKLGMSCVTTDMRSLREIPGAEGITCAVFETYEFARCAVSVWEMLGWRIPEDLSVAVLHTERRECAGDERITSISTCPESMGKKAVEMLISISEHPEKDCSEDILVKGRISEGGTVKNCRAKTASVE